MEVNIPKTGVIGECKYLVRSTKKTVVFVKAYVSKAAALKNHRKEKGSLFIALDKSGSMANIIDHVNN